MNPALRFYYDLHHNVYTQMNLLNMGEIALFECFAIGYKIFAFLKYRYSSPIILEKERKD